MLCASFITRAYLLCFQRSGRPRRRQWTESQVDAFKRGILRFGERGEWKRILHVYGDELQGRASGDLKDKWRKLEQVENLPFVEVDSAQVQAQPPPCCGTFRYLCLCFSVA